jgi:outer membrane protein OmpA-like peptidoglycan-associated protein
MRKFFGNVSVVCFGVLWSCLAFATADGGFTVKSYLSSGEDSKLVSIKAGHQSGIKTGEVFRIVRPGRSGINVPVETGLAKVVAVHDNEVIAEVIRQGTTESAALYGDFAGVMAGDLAVSQKLVIAPAKVVAPEISVKFSKIFDDPKADPVTYELTLGGHREISRIAERLAKIHAGMLVIEGHTDSKGSRERNQVESYQRALTVRQVLIDEFGFDEARVIALGLGESEPLSDVLQPGLIDQARRVVFKVVPMPDLM